METVALEQQIKQIIANTAGIDIADIDEKTSFVDDLALDSLTLLEIGLNRRYGVKHSRIQMVGLETPAQGT